MGLNNQVRRYSTSLAKENWGLLGPYLAGLIEGDGYRCSRSDPKSNTKVVYRPKILIVFNINDKPLKNCLLN